MTPNPAKTWDKAIKTARTITIFSMISGVPKYLKSQIMIATKSAKTTTEINVDISISSYTVTL